MIPKVIHYCWFGDKEIPLKEKKCIESWSRFFPGWKIKKWSEDNVDLDRCLFARQAYDGGYYAQVSDYLRAKVLFGEGGLYLDTDVYFVRPIEDEIGISDSEKVHDNGEGSSFEYDIESKIYGDSASYRDQEEPFYVDLSGISGFAGFERRAYLGTAVMAFQKNDPCMSKLLDYYENHPFIEDGVIDNLANVEVFTDIMENEGLKRNGSRQNFKGYEIFNREIFYPKKLKEYRFRMTNGTVAVHMASNSWMSDRERKRGLNPLWINAARPALQHMKRWSTKLLGSERSRKIELKIRNKLR